MEEEHVQWHSWIRECTSVQGSPSLRSLLRLSLGQLLCLTNSWTAALGRTFPGIFQPSPSPLAFPVPSSRDLNPPTPNPCFIFFLFLCNSHCGPAELLSQAVQGFPSISSLEEAGSGRFSKHHMSLCFGSLHWILTLG